MIKTQRWFAVVALCVFLMTLWHGPVAAQPAIAPSATAEPMPTATADTPSLAVLPGPVATAPPGWVVDPVEDTRIWPWLDSDRVPDPGIRYGRLDNGMRYAIRVNNLPEEAVSLRLSFDVGSTNEEEHERGYAHLLEHMAFNGSTNIPEGELTQRLERLGVGFGSHANASTGLRETVYRLDLPRGSDGRLETALDIFRETADRLLLEQAAIDREKGVVANEAASRDNVGRRLAREYAQTVYPRLRSTNRDPIGLPEVIEQATSASLRNFYQRWYRPERAVLVITGAVDPDATEALIRTKFANWRPALNEPNPPWQHPGQWEDNRAFAVIQTNAELPESFAVKVERPDPNRYSWRGNDASRRALYGHSMAEYLLNDRLYRLSQSQNPPFSFASYQHVRFSRQGWSGSLSFMPKDGNWQAGLDAVAAELRQALTHGFTQVEFDEYVADIRESARLTISDATTRQTSWLASEILSDLTGRTVTTTPEAQQEQMEAVLSQLTLEDVNAGLRFYWQGVEPRFDIKTKTEGITQEAVFDVWRAALAKPLEVRAADVPVVFVPPTVGPPGQVIQTWREEAIDTDYALYANGVILAFKRTGFSRDSVSMRVTLGAGQMDFDSSNSVWALMANTAWGADGFSDLTPQQISRAFVGRSTSEASTNIGPYTLELSAYSATRDMNEQLQVMLAQTIEPTLGTLGTTQMRSFLPQVWSARNITAGAVFSFNAPTYYLTGAGYFETQNLEAYLENDDAVGVARLRQMLKEAPIMVTIVGDIDFPSAQSAVAATYGALPPRTGLSPRTPTGIENWRMTATGGAPRVLYHQGPQTQSIVSVTWPARGMDQPQKIRALYVLAAVMQLRATDQIREARGQSYSPSAGASITSTELDLGRITLTAEVLPADVEEIEQIMIRIGAQLAATGPTADELDRAIGPMIEGYARYRQSNGFWAGLLSGSLLPLRAHQDPVPIWVYSNDYEANLRSFTTQEIQALAQEHFHDDNLLRIRVLPRPAEPVASQTVTTADPAPVVLPPSQP